MGQLSFFDQCRTCWLRFGPLLCALVAIVALPSSAAAAGTQENVATAWRLLDYISVDYGGAVQDHRIVSESEFAEMQEFSGTVERELAGLPVSSSKARLLQNAGVLRRLITQKASPADVAKQARTLGADLLQAYPVPMAPKFAPDLNRGTALYDSKCAECHGATGHGDGRRADTLDPRPINFSDRARASQRSVFAYKQVIDQGLDGTAMESFAELPDQDRWALAFRVGTFAYPASLASDGKRLWQADTRLRQRIPDLAALAAITPKVLRDEMGARQADAVIAYLRSNPGAVGSRASPGSLALARTKLADSIKAYQRGDRDAAKQLALSAYLDGFEPLEPSLSSRDGALLREVEQAMGEFRARIAQGRSSAELATQAKVLDGLFVQAERALAPSASSAASTFISAFTILLREGIEALLIVIAMIAFLRKAERPDALKYVHAGWAVALAAGAVTWVIATTMIAVSGASRELTEGFGGIFAAFVLVFVGIWMHGKANAEAWQRYVREKMDKALSQGSGWFLFTLAFVVVYRELFETILFFAAMWEDSATALLAGVIAGGLALAAIAFVMLRYSARLPITQFFRYSSVLMASLAVVLAGKGVGAIQEAGLIGVTPVPGFPRIDLLGIQPTLQVMLAQAAALIALVIGFYLTTRNAPHK